MNQDLENQTQLNHRIGDLVTQINYHVNMLENMPTRNTHYQSPKQQGSFLQQNYNESQQLLLHQMRMIQQKLQTPPKKSNQIILEQHQETIIKRKQETQRYYDKFVENLIQINEASSQKKPSLIVKKKKQTPPKRIVKLPQRTLVFQQEIKKKNIHQYFQNNSKLQIQQQQHLNQKFYQNIFQKYQSQYEKGFQVYKRIITRHYFNYWIVQHSKQLQLYVDEEQNIVSLISPQKLDEEIEQNSKHNLSQELNLKRTMVFTQILQESINRLQLQRIWRKFLIHTQTLSIIKKINLNRLKRLFLNWRIDHKNSVKKNILNELKKYTKSKKQKKQLNEIALQYYQSKRQDKKLMKQIFQVFLDHVEYKRNFALLQEKADNIYKMKFLQNVFYIWKDYFESEQRNHLEHLKEQQYEYQKHQDRIKITFITWKYQFQRKKNIFKELKKYVQMRLQKNLIKQVSTQFYQIKSQKQIKKQVFYAFLDYLEIKKNFFIMNLKADRIYKLKVLRKVFYKLNVTSHVKHRREQSFGSYSFGLETPKLF